jgi:hypothetical protein
MMDEHLNQAYELIKQGNKEQALALLEPFIRANRDNEDAWWLYANAVDDPAKKRNALNNILRIGTNSERESKVRYMLAQLDDPFALPDESFAPKAKHNAKQGKSTGLKIFMAIAAVFGVCACVAMFVLVSAAGKLAYIPGNYDARGSIVAGESVTGSINTDGDWDGYIYTGKAGEDIVISVRSVNGDVAPLVFFYGANGILVDGTDENELNVNRMHTHLLMDGEYTIIVRTMMGLAAGEYSLTITNE